MILVPRPKAVVGRLAGEEPANTTKPVPAAGGGGPAVLPTVAVQPASDFGSPGRGGQCPPIKKRDITATTLPSRRQARSARTPTDRNSGPRCLADHQPMALVQRVLVPVADLAGDLRWRGLRLCVPVGVEHGRASGLPAACNRGSAKNGCSPVTRNSRSLATGDGVRSVQRPWLAPAEHFSQRSAASAGVPRKRSMICPAGREHPVGQGEIVGIIEMQFGGVVAGEGRSRRHGAEDAMAVAQGFVGKEEA